VPDKLRHVRIGLDEANAFVLANHRHHKPVVGHLFSLGASVGDQIVGVAIVGRPVSRFRDDGLTAEVTRLCTDGTGMPARSSMAHQLAQRSRSGSSVSERTSSPASLERH
jgi:hypothetical protein